MILRFDKFSVDTESFELRCDGEVRPVEPMVFDLIAHFAMRPQQVFTREQLIDAVWKGRIVSDATVATCVKNARKALGDTGNAQTIIQTVRGRGFRFIADVQQNVGAAPAVRQHINSDEDMDPSLLILPFRCLSDDDEVHRLAERLAVDLSAILTRIPLLRISAQADIYRDAKPQPTARQIYEELSVDFVVDGSVQDVANKRTANIQLSNAKTGFRVWADSFDLQDPLADAIDRCIASIVGKLEPQLHRAMYQSVRSIDATPTARQLFLNASGILVTQGWHHESFGEALPLLRQSTANDPNFALAHALMSLLTGFGTRLGLAPDRAAAKAETVQAAEQALKIDSMDSTVLGYTGCSLADIGHLDRGESLLRNAIDLNTTNAQAIVALGTVRIAQNDLQDAVAQLSRGIEISPLDSRLSVWGGLLAVALLMSGDLDGAAEAARSACQRNDRTYLPRVTLAGARLARRDPAGALRAIADARRIKPDLTPRQIALLIGPDLRNGILALEKRAAT